MMQIKYDFNTFGALYFESGSHKTPYEIHYIYKQFITKAENIHTKHRLQHTLMNVYGFF